MQANDEQPSAAPSGNADGLRNKVSHWLHGLAGNRSSSPPRKPTTMIEYIGTKQRYDEVVASNSAVLIQFTASWCGPCKMVAPKLEELSRQVPGVVFFKVDIDENAEASDAMRVESVPTFLLYKDGKVVAQVVGANIERVKAMVTSVSPGAAAVPLPA